MTTAIAIDAFDTDLELEEAPPAAVVQRRVLDHRCKHGFLEKLCWNAACSHFNGRRNVPPKTLGPSSLPSSLPKPPLQPIPGDDGGLERLSAPLARQPESWTQLELAGLSDPNKPVTYGWAINATPTAIVALVAQAFGLTTKDIHDRCRMKHVALARGVAMYLVREVAGLSFPATGRAIGNRDHSTVMSAHRRIAERMQREPQVCAVVERLRAMIVTGAAG